MNNELFDLSAEDLVRHYSTRSLSPVEVLTAILRRIDAVNPKINAIATLNAEAAMHQARLSEQRWARGTPCGLFDGVPVTLKDSFPVADIPTYAGSIVAAPDRGGYQGDAPAVARLREHGAVFVATTTMPDWAMIPSGISSRTGITRNPWNLSRNPGGSSSGSGAAMAAGIGPLSVGTDGGGSLRIPAAFCGVFSLKPTYGRVPVHDPSPWTVAGPMARSVADVALLLNVLALPDDRDSTAMAYEATDYRSKLDRGAAGLRIGLVADIGFGPAADPQILGALSAAGRVLDRAGAIVSHSPAIFNEDPEPHFDRCVHIIPYLRFARLPRAEQEKLPPLLAEWCSRIVAENPIQIMSAIAAIGPIRRCIADAFAGLDYLLMPTMGVLPFAADQAWSPNHPSAHNPFCFPFNMSEQPAAAFNGGFSDDGLPIGLQVVGRRGDDSGVLQVVAAYVRAAESAAVGPGFREF